VESTSNVAVELNVRVKVKVIVKVIVKVMTGRSAFPLRVWSGWADRPA
jgi:hypothetical protein